MIRSCLFTCCCLFFTIGQSINSPKQLNSIALQCYNDHNTSLRQQQGVLDLLSYNTWGLPIELSGHDHERRFETMADSLLTLNKDIICLQETFHPRLRENLLTSLTQKYYTFSDYRCSSEIVPYIKKDCYGGLMTLSVYPIVKEKFYKYPTSDETSIIEKIGSKGFLYSVIQYGDRQINIINTHLYAGDNNKAERMRMEQLRFMYAVLDTVMQVELPTFMIGDFNIHHPDVANSNAYNYILDRMKFEDSKCQLDEKDYTCDSNCNKYVSVDNKPSKLDYIFYKFQNNLPPSVIHQSRCLDGKDAMSDHFGWAATVKI